MQSQVELMTLPPIAPTAVTPTPGSRLSNLVHQAQSMLRKTAILLLASRDDQEVLSKARFTTTKLHDKGATTTANIRRANIRETMCRRQGLKKAGRCVSDPNNRYVEAFSAQPMPDYVQSANVWDTT